MAYAKRWYVEKSFSKIGLASYVYDLTADQLQEALDALDSMMATWDSTGIRVGWSIPNADGESSLDDEVNVPYYAREPIFYQLGLRLAPNFGKTLSPEFRQAARDAMVALERQNAQPVAYQFPDTLPSGAGNKPWRTWDNPFLGPPVNELAAGGDGPIDFGTLNPDDSSQ